MELILVTGASGYIGTTLVPMLLAQGYRVRALDRYFFGREFLPEYPQIEYIQADSRHLEPAYLDGVDHISDLVAISNDPKRAVPRAELRGQSPITGPLRRARQGGRRQALPPAVFLQHPWIPRSEPRLRRNLSDQSAHDLRQGQPDGRARRPAAGRSRFRRRRATSGHGLRLQPSYAFRPRDQRHDLWGMEDGGAAPDARRFAVAPDGACPRHRERPDLHAPGPPRGDQRLAVQCRLRCEQLSTRSSRRDHLRRAAKGRPHRLIRRPRTSILSCRFRQDRGARLTCAVYSAGWCAQYFEQAQIGHDRQNKTDHKPQVL